MQIRIEKIEDIPFIRSINGQAFERFAEADLVDKLRQNCADHLSIIADDNGSIVGHIMYTPMQVGAHGKHKIQDIGLAPWEDIQDETFMNFFLDNSALRNI